MNLQLIFENLIKLFKKIFKEQNCITNFKNSQNYLQKIDDIQIVLKSVSDGFGF